MNRSHKVFLTRLVTCAIILTVSCSTTPCKSFISDMKRSTPGVVKLAKEGVNLNSEYTPVQKQILLRDINLFEQQVREAGDGEKPTDKGN